MSILTNELVYFTGKPERKRDFSGTENALSYEERLAFLRAYQENARVWYEDEKLDQKAVSQEEVADFVEKIAFSDGKVRKTIRFDTMAARESCKEPEYKGLQLYCGAKVENGALVFPGKQIRPTPCALYEVKEDVASFSSRVYIPAGYKSTQNRRAGTAQGSRLIELRCGTLDKVKIRICNSGEIFAMTRDKWEPRHIKLSNVRYGDWNDIAVQIGETVTFTVNGEKTEGIIPTVGGNVDGIFFDGGMFPREGWKVADLSINNEKIIFTKNPEYGKMLLDEGKEVSLPYAIGSYEKRDRQLLLTKTFTVADFEAATLDIETLDPCGKVWLNGQPVLDADDFTRHELDITAQLRKGENELKILVEPRAPEVYYYWHRHDDCYNGWFCGGVKLHLTARTHITDLKIRTNSVSMYGIKATAKLVLNAPFEGIVRLYAAKCWPEQGKEELMAETAVSGKEITFNFGTGPDDTRLLPWSDETPNLYAVRAVLLNAEGKETDDFVVETGFRTICQKDGEIYLNGNKVLLNGALVMQFLPPFKDVPVNHNCPTSQQIAWQAMMLKAMNGNFMRLHMLGYGSNDARFAQICDRLGIMMIWITRFIDTLEELVWDDGCWHEKDAYLSQIKAVMNHPSIIMYEGSNEFHPDDLAVIDRMYDEFTEAVTAVDDSRLLTPCSHLYYGGGIYDVGCKYYNDDGTVDEKGNAARSGRGWVHENVIRSTHTYSLLCGYGESWEAMRKQNWAWQDEMLASKQHSYLITEFAVTALPNPGTPEAVAEPYVRSYERPDELGVMGREFADDEWMESQALQALAAFNAVKKMRLLGVDGMTWCCLSSGANNGSYMKPPIDFNGYKKLGFYGLKDAYRKAFAATGDTDISYGSDDEISPVLVSCDKGIYDLTVDVIDKNGTPVHTVRYGNIVSDRENVRLSPFKPAWENEGYYTLRFDLKKRQ